MDNTSFSPYSSGSAYSPWTLIDTAMFCQLLASKLPEDDLLRIEVIRFLKEKELFDSSERTARMIAAEVNRVAPTPTTPSP
jgi:hypothetical protein